MPAQAFVDALNEQIANEFAASQQYVAIAVYYDAETLPRLAAFFYSQALEERTHAMMMVQYLLDAGVDPGIPGVEAPQAGFGDIVAPVSLALAQEKRVSEEITRLAAFFYAQALEERNHAMMMVQYLMDAGVDPVIPGVEPPQVRFDDIVAPVALALEQERRVSEQVSSLAMTAREAGDYASEQFMSWFIREQVEEVSSMNDLLTIVTRSKDDPLRAEEYLARETTAGAEEPPGAPPAAGG